MGFHLADVADVGVQMLVIADDDEQAAARVASALGEELWGLRESAAPTYLSPDEAIAEAGNVRPPLIGLSPSRRTDRRGARVCSQAQSGPVVMADVRDNPGGGTAGDGTVLLERMLTDGRLGTIGFSSIYDPQAVSLCHAAGEGSTLQLRFGGKTSHLGGQPLDALVQVRRLLDDTPTTFMGRGITLGRSAHVSIPLSGGGACELILNDRRLATTHPDVWDSFAVDALACDVLVVKSANHFMASFGPVASQVIYVDTGLFNGLAPAPGDPKQLNYTKLARPVWPMAENPRL